MMEEVGNIVPVPHPLLIPHVLDNAFAHLFGGAAEDGSGNDKLQELSEEAKNMRLVCTDWRDSSTRAFRSLRPWMYFGIDSVIDSTATKLEKFVETMRGCTVLPVEHFALEQSIFNNKENCHLFENLLEVCKQEMEGLSLQINYRFFLRADYHVESRRMNLMNLRQLHMHFISFDYLSQQYWEDYGIPDLLKMLLKSVPSLTCLFFQLTNVGMPDHYTARCVLDMCRRIPQSVTKLQLVVPYLDDFHSEALIERNLKLEEIELYCMEMEMSAEAFCNFLRHQSTTLKKLHVTGFAPFSVFEELPVLPELTDFKLHWIGPYISGISLSEKFPKLLKINLRRLLPDIDFVEELTAGNTVLTVKELVLPYEFPQAPHIPSAARCFPNVKDLYISRSTDIEETLQAVFTHFTGIESLSISFLDKGDELNGDSLLSGISAEDCNQILSQGGFNIVNLDELRRKPSILQLTKLRKLSLEFCEDVTFTDFFPFILEQMPSLEELYSDELNISTKNRRILEKQLKTFKLRSCAEQNPTT